MRKWAILASILTSSLCFVVGGSSGETFIAGGVGYGIWYLMMIYDEVKED